MDTFNGRYFPDHTKKKREPKLGEPIFGHFGIAGPWAWTLNPEMLDYGLIFWPKNTQNLLLIHGCSKFCVFLGRYFRKYGSRVQHIRVIITGAPDKVPEHQPCICRPSGHGILSKHFLNVIH